MLSKVRTRFVIGTFVRFVLYFTFLFWFIFRYLERINHRVYLFLRVRLGFNGILFLRLVRSTLVGVMVGHTAFATPLTAALALFFASIVIAIGILFCSFTLAIFLAFLSCFGLSKFTINIVVHLQLLEVVHGILPRKIVWIEVAIHQDKDIHFESCFSQDSAKVLSAPSPPNQSRLQHRSKHNTKQQNGLGYRRKSSKHNTKQKKGLRYCRKKKGLGYHQKQARPRKLLSDMPAYPCQDWYGSSPPTPKSCNSIHCITTSISWTTQKANDLFISYLQHLQLDPAKNLQKLTLKCTKISHDPDPDLDPDPDAHVPTLTLDFIEISHKHYPDPDLLRVNIIRPPEQLSMISQNSVQRSLVLNILDFKNNIPTDCYLGESDIHAYSYHSLILHNRDNNIDTVCYLGESDICAYSYHSLTLHNRDNNIEYRITQTTSIAT